MSERLEAIEGGIKPCLNCGVIHRRLKMTARIAVGFGYAGVTKDGKEVWSEPHNYDWGDLPTLMTFENMARKEPDADWRAIIDGPLSMREYQRHGRNEWVLVRKGMGFA